MEELLFCLRGGSLGALASAGEWGVEAGFEIDTGLPPGRGGGIRPDKVEGSFDRTSVFVKLEEADVLLVLLFLRSGSCGGGSVGDVAATGIGEASVVSGSDILGVATAFTLLIEAVSSIALLIAALTSLSVAGWTGGHGLVCESGLGRAAFGDVELVEATPPFDGVGAPRPGNATLVLFKDAGLVTLGDAGGALDLSSGLMITGSLTLGGLEAA